MPFPSNGGYKFRQPQLNWENPAAMIGEEASIDAIIAVRKANPAISAKHGLSTDREVVRQELTAFQQARGALPMPTQPVFFSPQQSRLPSRVVAAAAEIKTAAKGTAVILDWLTSGGKPAAPELATARAKVCSECPHNQDGSWFTVAPAELIRATLSARSDLKLETAYDDKLKSCNICRCLNRLKPHVPLQHIKGHTAPEIMAAFPESCWIKMEIKALT
jgi:hypothetical protein